MDRLQKHYTQKYENIVGPKLIEEKSIPINRLEAAIKFLPKFALNFCWILINF